MSTCFDNSLKDTCSSYDNHTRVIYLNLSDVRPPRNTNEDLSEKKNDMERGVKKYDKYYFKESIGSNFE